MYSSKQHEIKKLVNLFFCRSQRRNEKRIKLAHIFRHHSSANTLFFSVRSSREPFFMDNILFNSRYRSNMNRTNIFEGCFVIFLPSERESNKKVPNCGCRSASFVQCEKFHVIEFCAMVEKYALQLAWLSTSKSLPLRLQTDRFASIFHCNVKTESQREFPIYFDNVVMFQDFFLHYLCNPM